jgi:hypothetical protein
MYLLQCFWSTTDSNSYWSQIVLKGAWWGGFTSDEKLMQASWNVRSVDSWKDRTETWGGEVWVIEAMFRCSIGCQVVPKYVMFVANFTLIWTQRKSFRGLIWTIPRATTHHISPRNPCPPVPFCAEFHVDIFCNSSGSSLPSDFFVHFRVFSLHLVSQKNVPYYFL